MPDIDTRELEEALATENTFLLFQYLKAKKPSQVHSEINALLSRQKATLLDEFAGRVMQGIYAADNPQNDFRSGEVKVPTNLIISGGVISMKATEEQPVTTYLREWQTRRQITDGTEVCVIASADLQKLMDELHFYRSLIWAA